MNTYNTPYLNEAIGKLPLDLQQILYHVPANTKSTPEAVLASIISALASTTQNIADVGMPYGGQKPLGTLVCMLSSSGGGKSSALNAIIQPILDADTSNINESEHEIKAWKSEQKIHAGIEKKLIAKIAKADLEEDKHHDAREKLRIHLQKAPQPPKKKTLVTKDATIDALLSRMQQCEYGQLLVSDEASHNIRNLFSTAASTVNTLWDGSNYSVERISRPSFELTSPRLSIHLMLQPELLIAFMKQHGSTSMASGIWARTLVCEANPNFGYRSNISAQTLYLNVFHDKLKNLLDIAKTRAASKQPRRVLYWSPDAQTAWQQFADNTELHMSPNMGLHDCKAFLAKAPENMARIAAQLQLYIDSDSTVIGFAATTAASAIMSYFITEHQRLFGQNGRLNEDYMHVEQLHKTLQKLAQRLQTSCISKSVLQRNLPNSMRNKKELFNRVLEQLELSGVIAQGHLLNPYTNTPINRQMYVHLNPAYFPQNIPYCWHSGSIANQTANSLSMNI